MRLIGEVLSVIPKREVKGQVVDYGHKLMDVAGSWAKSYTGKNIPVYVIDTGIAPHPDLKIKGGKSFVLGACSLAFWRLFDAWSYRDFNGHGTHCAGIIGASDNKIGVVGVAPDCDLWAVKVLEPAAWQGGESALARGIEWATKHAIKEYGYGGVISMSLGGRKYSKKCHLAIKEAVKLYMIVGAAAGNEGGQLCYPAKLPEVVSVGAVDKNKVRADWSNYGMDLDAVAPGVDVYSTYTKKRYCKLSGTSMAWPAMAGISALAKGKYGKKFGYEDFKKLLWEGCIDLGAPGKDSKYGWGLVQSPRIAQLNGRNFEVFA